MVRRRPRLYSGFAGQGGGASTTGQNFLRGYQLSTGPGNTKFVGVYLGWCSGRTVQIHFRVRTYSGTTVTYDFISQMFFTDALSNQIDTNYAPYNARNTRTTLNTNDGIYNGGSQGNGRSVASGAGSFMLARVSGNSSQVIASFNVVL